MDKPKKKCALEGCNKTARIRFCCNAHKDRYHNLHNPRGIYAHLRDGRISIMEEHPLSAEALGQL